MSIAAALGAAQIYVEDAFLSGSEVEALLQCLFERHRAKGFQAAKIGSRQSLRHESTVRGDATCWLSEPLYPAEGQLLARLEALRCALNRELLLGLFDLELHYAWYPPGAGYDRHVDQPLGSDARQVSLILYLNEAWNCEAGGELRIYEKDGTFKDIAPSGGRLVCFRSPGREHAVRAAHRDRFSISGWFRIRG